MTKFMNNLGYCIMVDIEKELLSIERGECPGCRIGITHPVDKPCYFNKQNYVKMEYCPKCNNMFNPNFKQGKCPVCN